MKTGAADNIPLVSVLTTHRSLWLCHEWVAQQAQQLEVVQDHIPPTQHLQHTTMPKISDTHFIQTNNVYDDIHKLT